MFKSLTSIALIAACCALAGCDIYEVPGDYTYDSSTYVSRPFWGHHHHRHYYPPASSNTTVTPVVPAQPRPASGTVVTPVVPAQPRPSSGTVVTPVVPAHSSAGNNPAGVIKKEVAIAKRINRHFPAA